MRRKNSWGLAIIFLFIFLLVFHIAVGESILNEDNSIYKSKSRKITDYALTIFLIIILILLIYMIIKKKKIGE